MFLKYQPDAINMINLKQTDDETGTKINTTVDVELESEPGKTSRINETYISMRSYSSPIISINNRCQNINSTQLVFLTLEGGSFKKDIDDGKAPSKEETDYRYISLKFRLLKFEKNNPSDFIYYHLDDKTKKNDDATTQNEEEFATLIYESINISDDFGGDTNILEYFNEHGYLKNDKTIDEAIDFLISNNIINLSG